MIQNYGTQEIAGQEAEQGVRTLRLHGVKNQKNNLNVLMLLWIPNTVFWILTPLRLRGYRRYRLAPTSIFTPKATRIGHRPGEWRWSDPLIPRLMRWCPVPRCVLAPLRALRGSGTAGSCRVRVGSDPLHRPGRRATPHRRGVLPKASRPEPARGPEALRPAGPGDLAVEEVFGEVLAEIA